MVRCRETSFPSFPSLACKIGPSPYGFAKPFRGQGLVPKMYNLFKESLINQYDYCVTDISEANPRSIRAHEKCGFKIIDTLEYEGVKWHIVIWDWINNSK